MIKVITGEDYKACYEVIIEANKQVADQMAYTKETCPGNSAFLSYNKFLSDLSKGLILYGFYDEDLIACIGLIKKSPTTSKFLYLSVLPTYRHRGIGQLLVSYVESQVSGKMKLGMIYENKRLLTYYESLGYETKKVSSYKGSVYHIAYMEKNLEKNI